MLIYNIAIWLYGRLIFLTSFFNVKAKKWVVGRKNWSQQLSIKMSSLKNPIWIHCASLGEFEQGRPLIEAIKKEYPHEKILLTFFSPSGFEIQKNYQYADVVAYLPLDTKQNAKEFIQIVKPKLVVFVKYEFWLNYLFQLKKATIPTFIISAIFRPNQIFFKWYGKLFRDALVSFGQIFVQNLESGDCLKRINITNYTIAADTRFDRVYQNSLNVQLPEIITSFASNHKIIIAGSTWDTDETMILNWWNNEQPSGWKLIVVPHEITNHHTKNIISKIKGKTICFTNYNTFSEQEVVEANVLIVDTIGYLSKIYSIGHLAYVGGGFGSGIHNTLEPAVFGLPVIFGPKFNKFNEAKMMIKNGAAFSVCNEQQFAAIVNELMKNVAYLNDCGQKNKEMILENIGGTSIILKYFKTCGLLNQ